ncbi:sigma-70 family RNA polymerase sigma factor [Actinotalea ferrariae]|nr:sigma-70 family RNA polymerase sigma factor [Actinotalea ferrariae]
MSPVTFEHDFQALVAPLRRELIAHCYRMVGSAHEAEDLVQETLLRAWRAFHGFENRSSVRTWMYRIATNTCLTALEGRKRRPLPTGLGQPAADPRGDLHRHHEVSWVEPLPDSVVWGSPDPDPADVVVGRDSVRLALVAALQELTAQQRAVVLLCDVLGWRAAEAASTLGLSVGAVTSTLQRARAHLEKSRSAEPAALDHEDPRVAALLERYQRAFEDYDMEGLVRVLTEDALWEMPPYAEWFQGNEDIARLVSTHCPAERAGDMRLVRASANGGPALALYMRGEDGVHRAFNLHLPVVTADGVAHVTAYFGEEHFTALGLPLELAADGGVPTVPSDGGV